MFNNNDIAITGMSARLPFSDSIERFRDNLFENKDLLDKSGSRWPTGLYDLPHDCGLLTDIDEFDDKFFDIDDIDINDMDPQLRLLLEVTTEAVLDSGYRPEELPSENTGLFIGVNYSDALTAHLANAPNISRSVFYGCDISMFSALICRSLNISGPSMAINTGCSSGAMAFHQALVNLRYGECEAALVVGVHLILNPAVSVMYDKAGLLSADSRCKFMDSSADGFVRSEACTALLLQRATDAKRIYSLVVHSKTCTDSSDDNKLGVLAELMKSTLREANVEPGEVSFIEASGSCTKEQDQIEIEAINQAYCEQSGKHILIGCVKTNVGHTGPVSGLVSIIKVLIAMENNKIPASLHLNEPNHEINALKSGAIKPVIENTPLEGDVVAINSLSLNNSMVHILLKRFNNNCCDVMVHSNDIPELIPLFGSTNECVRKMCKIIMNNSDKINEDFISLLNNITKLNKFKYRGFIINNGRDTVPRLIHNCAHKRPLWFIFPGFGCQWPKMAKNLMKIDIFEKSIKESANIVNEFGMDLIDILVDDDSNEIFNDISKALIAIAAIQIALIDLFRHIGIEPDAFIGHSLGELICAYCDGCLDKKQLFYISYTTNTIIKNSDISRGLMAVVGLPWDDCVRRCPEGVVTACHNSEHVVTVSGEYTKVHRFLHSLKAEKIFTREVNTCGVAFHSDMIVQAIDRALSTVKPTVPGDKLRSDKWISSSIAESNWGSDLAKYGSPEYFHNNAISPVLFYSAVKHVPKDAIVVEVSPNAMFESIVRQTVGSSVQYIPTMSANNNSGNVSMLLSAIGRLYELGLNPDITRIYPPITYPVRSGTPSLSSAIKWDHSSNWFVPQYPYNFRSNYND